MLSWKNILEPECQDYINRHLKTDTVKLLLGKSNYDTNFMKLIIEQINAKRKSEKKLPTWFSNYDIIYPNKLNIEQTSSESTAKYKTELLKGNTIADLTGGFGVDAYYFSKQFEEVTHCELNPELSQKVKHNFEVLKRTNIECLEGDGIELVKSKRYDWLYIDPSRRSESKGKVFLLGDCLPNVPLHLDRLFESTDHICIKVSPMLDISQGIRELKFVKEVHVVALKNEVKELLFILEKEYDAEIQIHSTHLQSDTKKENFTYQLGDSKYYNLKEIDKYLYEPNASIMKTGGYNYIGRSFELGKLHSLTHLFTGSDLISFPGRRFTVISTQLFNKKEVKKKYGKTSYNVVTRNFPKTVAQLRTEYNILDKDGNYLFFVTGMNDSKWVIEAKLIQTSNI